MRSTRIGKWLALGVTTLASSTAACAAAPHTRSARSPMITVTSPVPDDRAAETHLSLFIRALQLGQRQKAARLLSKKVPAKEREALVQNRWLRRNPRARKDFGQVLFIPDLQIRTEKLNPRTLVVLPRTKRKKGLTGALRVRMNKENGSWLVELHPDRPL